MTRPYFTKERISHFELFNRHAEKAIAKAKARLNEGLPIDFQVRGDSHFKHRSRKFK